APPLRDLAADCEGRLLFGADRFLARETAGLLVAAMSLPGVLDRLGEDHVVVLAADRAGALLPALVAAHRSADFPTLAGVVLTGGAHMPEPVWRLLSGMDIRLPVLVTDQDTFTTAARLAAVRGAITPGADRKIEAALATFSRSVDGAELLERLRVEGTGAVTPLMFEHGLLARARAHRAHVVLAEGAEERVLRTFLWNEKRPLVKNSAGDQTWI
ncbi:DRTGG domain-containing protein, partial [Streptomonospora algeriensis]